MSNIVTGGDLPKDLAAVLKKYGMPEHCTKFVIELYGPNEPLLITAAFYARMPQGDETFPDVEETRTFKLLAVE